MTSDDGLSKALIAPVQIYNSQGNMAENECLHRTSNVLKSAPVTRRKIFFIATEFSGSPKNPTSNQLSNNISKQVYKSHHLIKSKCY